MAVFYERQSGGGTITAESAILSPLNNFYSAKGEKNESNINSKDKRRDKERQASN